MSVNLPRNRFLSLRLGSLRSDRPFIAWYLTQRRLSRLPLPVVNGDSRLAEDGQARLTEDGQSRELES